MFNLIKIVLQYLDTTLNTFFVFKMKGCDFMNILTNRKNEKGNE